MLYSVSLLFISLFGFPLQTNPALVIFSAFTPPEELTRLTAELDDYDITFNVLNAEWEADGLTLKNIEFKIGTKGKKLNYRNFQYNLLNKSTLLLLISYPSGIYGELHMSFTEAKEFCKQSIFNNENRQPTDHVLSSFMPTYVVHNEANTEELFSKLNEHFAVTVDLVKKVREDAISAKRKDDQHFRYFYNGIALNSARGISEVDMQASLRIEVAADGRKELYFDTPNELSVFDKYEHGIK